jgi:hypothetical protein
MQECQVLEMEPGGAVIPHGKPVGGGMRHHRLAGPHKASAGDHASVGLHLGGVARSQMLVGRLGCDGALGMAHRGFGGYANLHKVSSLARLK